MSTQEKIPRGRLKNKTEGEAERLNISKAELLDLYHKGIVPGVRVSERIILFDPIETDRALSDYATKQTPKHADNNKLKY